MNSNSKRDLFSTRDFDIYLIGSSSVLSIVTANKMLEFRLHKETSFESRFQDSIHGVLMWLANQFLGLIGSPGSSRWPFNACSYHCELNSNWR